MKDDEMNKTTKPGIKFTIFPDESPNYKYNENKYIDEMQQYVDSTYQEHYSSNKYQATEFILDSGHGTGFCMGNILKYAQRYGRKAGYNRNDLLKIIHYTMIQLHNHDVNNLGNKKE